MWWLVLLIGGIIGIILSIVLDDDMTAFALLVMLSLMFVGVMFIFGISSTKEVNVYEKKKYNIEGLENKLITER